MLGLKQMQERLSLKRDYAETFGTSHGQRVLAHLLRVAGVTHPKFTTDADQLRWNEAQRHFAMSIFRQVHGSMDKLPDLIVEQLKHIEQESTQ